MGYMGEPRLVKQWRKKDFANQYFTMSMQRLPGKDGIHWPLILNVPGEGFGDDFLQHWSDHRVLTESEESEFLLDEFIEKSGGKCQQQVSENGADGPPTGQQAHVPSNLEREEASWREIVWTGSPVWKSNPKATQNGNAPGVVQVDKTTQAQACFDDATSTLRLTMYLPDPGQAWVGVAFRESAECLMTPRGGGNTPLVYTVPDANGKFTTSHGTLTPAMKKFDAGEMASFTDGLTLLSEMSSFDGNFAVVQNGKLEFGFARKYSSKPTAIHLTFALGSSPRIGYHQVRECFKVENPPACPRFSCSSKESGPPSGKVPDGKDVAEKNVTKGAKYLSSQAWASTCMAAYSMVLMAAYLM